MYLNVDMKRLPNIIRSLRGDFYMFAIGHLTYQLSAAQLCVTEENMG